MEWARVDQGRFALTIVPARERMQRVFELCGVDAIRPLAGVAPRASRHAGVRSRHVRARSHS